MGNATDLKFDPESHTYTVDGRVVPNVTRVLDLLGTYAHIPDEVLDWKSDVGKAVHKATELYDQDDLDYASLDPAIVGYVDAWVKFMEEVNPVILAIEERVYHGVLNYAGTVDRIAIFNRQRRNTILPLEIKCTAQTHAIHRLQTAAYYSASSNTGSAYKLNHSGMRACAYLFPDGKYKLDFHYSFSGDFATFSGLLNVYNWLNKEGKL